jgi:hypothetical protein
VNIEEELKKLLSNIEQLEDLYSRLASLNKEIKEVGDIKKRKVEHVY